MQNERHHSGPGFLKLLLSEVSEAMIGRIFGRPYTLSQNQIFTIDWSKSTTTYPPSKRQDNTFSSWTRSPLPLEAQVSEDQNYTKIQISIETKIELTAFLPNFRKTLKLITGVTFIYILQQFSLLSTSQIFLIRCL